MARLKTTTDLAEILGVRKQTLRRWRQEGRGPLFVRFGYGRNACVRYRDVDIDAWLTENTFQMTSAATANRQA